MVGGFDARPAPPKPDVPLVRVTVKPLPPPPPPVEEVEELGPAPVAVKPVPVDPQPLPPVKPHRQKPPPVAVASKDPAPREEAAVPAGEGRLRIGTLPASAVGHIVVGRDDWGPAPVDRKVSSGHYVVSVKMENGKKSVAWKGPVLPDRTTLLVYDIDKEAWQVK